MAKTNIGVKLVGQARFEMGGIMNKQYQEHRFYYNPIATIWDLVPGLIGLGLILYFCR